MEKKISISFDKEADVMYLSFGEPAKAEGEEIEEGVFARYDPKSRKLVGLTVVNFSKKFGIAPKEIAIPEFA
ncbi:MAG: DUF2283 domain-containing protein [Elusimicrobiota bacterium]|nr:DUF2283 domain-containing protein [Elusimicrobiota bacterium]